MFGDSWRGVRGRESGFALPRPTAGMRVPGTGIQKSTLQRTVEMHRAHAAERFFSPSMPIESVQAVGVAANPVAAMNNMHFAGVNGLGLVNSAFCDSFEQAIEVLGQALERAKGLGVSNVVFAQAQKVYADETSLLLWRRTSVHVGNCEGQTARIATLIDSVNAELSRLGSAPVMVPPSIREQQNDAQRASGEKPPDLPMDPTVKFAIVGGIVVAGIIGVAVITGQVAPLFRAVKKVL